MFFIKDQMESSQSLFCFWVYGREELKTQKELCPLDSVKCDFPVSFVNIKRSVLSKLWERNVCFWKPRNIGDECMTCLGTCDIGLLLEWKNALEAWLFSCSAQVRRSKHPRVHLWCSHSVGMGFKCVCVCIYWGKCSFIGVVRYHMIVRSHNCKSNCSTPSEVVQICHLFYCALPKKTNTYLGAIHC